MQFTAPERPPRRSDLTPLIDVVFMLLVFFMLTSHLAPPEPFEVDPPSSADGTDPEADPILYVDKTGLMGFEGAFGPDALVKLSARSAEDSIVRIRADAQLEARALARMLRDLAEVGLTGVELVVLND